MEVACFAAFGAALPLGSGIAARVCVTYGGWKWALTGWSLFGLLTTIWISIMLPSFNNVRGWNAVETRGLLIGLVVGTITGAVLPLLRHAQVMLRRIRSLRDGRRRGFPVSIGAAVER